ncbi:hypothetical protein IT575_15440 [bacterium]|nr:hypothetical protein [bacterium]
MNRTATARPLGGRLNLICSGAAALGCALLFTFASSTASAAEEENGVLVISGSDEAFDSLREVVEPGRSAETVEDVIKKFFPETVVHEGTYPASEALEHDFDLRREKPEEIKYSGRFFGKYSKEELSDVEKWEKEFELNLSKGEYDAYIRVSDVNAFPNETEPFRLNKARLRYRWEDGKLTVGSFGALFGRGLTLNMFEERFLEFDNEVEGVLFEQDLADNVELVALYGTRKDFDEPSRAVVYGTRLFSKLNDHLSLGAHAARVTFPASSYNAEHPDRFEYDITGADAAISFGNFKLYTEAARLDRPAVGFAFNPYDGEGKNGAAYYGSASYSVPGLSLTAEMKNYKGMIHPFNVLPPIRRWQEKSTADPNDDVGYGVGMNWNPLGNGSFFTFGYAQDNSKDAMRSYTEAFATYNSPGGQDFSYILEQWHVQEAGERHTITRATLNQILNEDWTTTLYTEREHFNNEFGDGFTDYILEPELAYQSLVNLIFRYETTGKDVGESQSAWRFWELKLHPSELEELNISLGSRRAGFVCSGGVCRQEPEFKGFRVDFTRRF